MQERKAGKMISRRAVLWGAPLGLGALPAWAQEAEPVTIGVLTDMSGMYENATGHGAVEAARLAIEDSGGSVLGRPIRLLVADHQNKPDIGTAILAKWYKEDNATAAFEFTTSSIALSAFHLATQKHKIAVATGPGLLGAFGFRLFALRVSLGL